MKRTGEKVYCLTDKPIDMKKILILLTACLLLASCSEKLTEKVMAKFPNGQPRVVRYFDKQDRCVKETEFYDSGQVKMEGGMLNDKMEGEWTSYFPDGRVQSHGFFKDGERTGYGEAYYYNGNMYQEGSYSNGKHCGKWKFYDEQGYLLKEVDFGECE